MMAISFALSGVDIPPPLPYPAGQSFLKIENGCKALVEAGAFSVRSQFVGVGEQGQKHR